MSIQPLLHLPTLTMANELQRAFDFFNERLFQGVLPNCLITLQREKGTYGYLHRCRYVRRDGRDFAHELAINPSYFASCTLRFTLSILGHEACHLLQLVAGKPGRRGYHNAEWGAMMEAIGLMPSDTGEPGGKRVGERMSHYIIKDGLFDRAAAELIEEERFSLTWIDRYPMAVPRGMSLPQDYTPPRVEEVEARIHSVGGLGTLDTLAPARTEGVAAEPMLAPVRLGDLPDQPDARELPERNLRGAAAAIAWPSDASSRSTRTKYRCPGCEAQVWGRPNLDIRCGRCGGVQYRVETDTRGYGARR